MKLMNNGKRSLGLPGDPAIVLHPGQSKEVSAHQLEGYRNNKTVSRWLDAGLISVDGKAVKQPSKPEPETKEPDHRPESELPEGVTGEGIEVWHKGAGWYRVYVNGLEVTDKNVRKDEASEIAAEYE